MINHLNGEAALCFSRERYAFADGDNQRGKNQMAVIQAIISKASSPAVLKNYQTLLSSLSDAFITSLSYDDIASLVQMQLQGYVRLARYQLRRLRLRQIPRIAMLWAMPPGSCAPIWTPSIPQKSSSARSCPAKRLSSPERHTQKDIEKKQGENP